MIVASGASEPLSLLVHHDRPELFLDLIETGFPAARVSCCRSYDALAESVAEARPEVVLSYKFEPRPYPRAPVFAQSCVRWVHYGGAGIDHLAPWNPAQVTVTNSAGIASAAIAEYTLGAIYALNMRLPAFMHAQAERRWSAGEVTVSAGQTLCVVGLGHIGKSIAKLARTVGFRVIGVRKSGAAMDAADAVYPADRLAEALAQADHTAVIVPLTAQTRGLIGAKEIAAMKPGSTLINVSRGGVVEEAPLIAALEKNHLGGAVLDVFSAEPLPAGSPLWGLPNVIATPHIAGSFTGWERAAAEVFCENLRRYLAGTPLANTAEPG